MLSSPALTVLQKTSKLLPRALAPNSELKLWQNVLANAYNRLTSRDQPVQLLVCDLDASASAKDLVTVLLDEPFSGNDNLRQRWVGRQNEHVLSIQYSESTASEPSLLYAPFPFLREFGTPLAVQECHSRDDALMVNADVPVILCDPLTTHPKSIQNDPILRTNPNAIVVFTSSFSSTTPPQTPNGPTLLFADPRRANSALQTLHANPTSPVAVQRYQDEYISSQISDIFAAIRAALNPSTGTPIHIHLALSHVQAALNACALSVQKAKDDLAALSTSISVVAGQVQESRARMANEVFSTSFQDDVVKVALEKAEAEVKASMDRLTAWRTIWRVDDISSIISGAVDGAWCKDLESHLIFQAGRLSVLQKELEKTTLALLSRCQGTPLDSAVLQNKLLQLRASPAYTVHPAALISPIAARRLQMQYPTGKLHYAGQQMVATVGGSCAAGVGLSWAGWFGLFASGPFADPGTVVGVSILGSLLAVSLSLKKWDKAKRLWWEDWHRIGDGLGRDLRTTLDHTMQHNVLSVAQAGTSGLQRHIANRQDDIATVEEELEVLGEEVAAAR